MARIRFQKLTIGSIRDSSAVFSGDNIQLQWRNVTKINEGFGTVSGDDNPVERTVAIVLDNDVWDWKRNGRREDEP